MWNKKSYTWFYDRIHSHYYNLLMKWCFFPFGGEDKLRESLLGLIPLRSGEKVLDMCCGTGNNTFALARRLGTKSSITGIDLSVGQIEQAERRNRFSNVDFKVMDASNTEFGKDSFDLVIIPHALHEMKRTVRLTVLKEANHLLKKDGRLVVLEMDRPRDFFLRLFIGFLWFYWLPFNFETPTRRSMFKYGLVNEVREAGFREVSKVSSSKGVFQVVQGQK